MQKSKRRLCNGKTSEKSEDYSRTLQILDKERETSRKLSERYANSAGNGHFCDASVKRNRYLKSLSIIDCASSINDQFVLILLIIPGQGEFEQ
jgi:hypothetical protein